MCDLFRGFSSGTASYVYAEPLQAVGAGDAARALLPALPGARGLTCGACPGAASPRQLRSSRCVCPCRVINNYFIVLESLSHRIQNEISPRITWSQREASSASAALAVKPPLRLWLFLTQLPTKRAAFSVSVEQARGPAPLSKHGAQDTPGSEDALKDKRSIWTFPALFLVREQTTKTAGVSFENSLLRLSAGEGGQTVHLTVDAHRLLVQDK